MGIKLVQWDGKEGTEVENWRGRESQKFVCGAAGAARTLKLQCR